VAARGRAAAVYFALTVLILVLPASLGNETLPQVDAGQLHACAPRRAHAWRRRKSLHSKYWT
jgi:hypothetical protein